MQTSIAPVITVRGDPFSRGRQLGEQAGEQVRRGINFYLDLWQDNKGMSRDYVLGQAAEFAAIIQDYDPNILDELKGISQGAGCSLDELIALNARYEFIWAEMQDPEKRPGECTAFGIQPRKATGGHTLIAQNWDYLSAVDENCVITEVYQDDKPNVVFHGEAGIIGQKGMNSAGLGLCVNALISEHDGFRPAVPFFTIARAVLNSSTIDEARTAVARARKSVSGNMLIGSDSGDMVDLELTPVDVASIDPDDDGLTHANNFQALGADRDVTDKWDRLIPEMKARPARARTLLSDSGAALEADSLKTFLSDHETGPHSICAHDRASDPDHVRSKTLASVIFDLNERSMLIAEGPPCSNPYRHYTFDGLS